MAFSSWISLLVIVLTILGVSIGRYPYLRMNRATIAFAGNLTLLGSVVNLIVVESARKLGVHLSFGEYFRSGALITLVTLVLGILWLALF